jgi:hypothetical protein
MSKEFIEAEMALFAKQAKGAYPMQISMKEWSH